MTSRGWIFTPLIDLSIFIKRGKSPTYTLNKEIPVIAQKCNQKNGILSLTNALFISNESLKKYNETNISELDDIIINSTGTGTVGRTNIIKENIFNEYKTIVYDSHITTIRLFKKHVSPYYIYYFLKSPYISDNIEDRCEGSTNQIELYAKVIMQYIVPLPPKNEQLRIVSKLRSINQLIEK